MFFPSAYGKLRANRRETARLTVQKSVQRDVLAQHLPDGLCNAQVGGCISPGGLHIDDHQVVAPEVPDEPGGGVHHQTGAADDKGIGMADGIHRAGQHLLVQALFVKHHVRLYDAAALGAAGHTGAVGNEIHIVELTAAGAVVAQGAAVQLVHRFAARRLMQAVNVLGDHGPQLALLLQLGQPQMGGVGLCPLYDQLIAVKTVKFLRVFLPEGMAEDGFGRYARVNDFGFIETPYRVIRDCQKTDEVVSLDATREADNQVIAQANARFDENGRLADDNITVRVKGEVEMRPKEEVTLMDVAPGQMVSISAALIPFLEHDDANRALMGSNMQRQAVPLLRSELPIVGTGMEVPVARDSGACIVAPADGIVRYADADRIVVEYEGDVFPTTGGVKAYDLLKFHKSNQNTCFSQKATCVPGQIVKKGDVLADGPGIDNGTLALGKNLVVAFMPWCGYNYEDAILISEKTVKEDTFTSIHIEEFEVVARDTKLGPEEITRDIPNVGEDMLRNLDESGIIRIGAPVKTDDILVGRITPKGETQLTPEEKLLRAIFGEKARDVRNSSLKVPPGVEGTVIDVKVFNRRSGDKDERTKAIERHQIEILDEKEQEHISVLAQACRDRLAPSVIGKQVNNTVLSNTTKGAAITAGASMTREALDQIPPKKLSGLFKSSETNDIVEKALEEYDRQLQYLKNIYDAKREKATEGDDLPPGVIRMVKVHVAIKRKLSVGDKMAGRHGNKGVVSMILPEEDMPFFADGRPVDIVLNPLGVPSRMNIGQIMETHLGWGAKELGRQLAELVDSGKAMQVVRDEVKDVFNSPEISKAVDEMDDEEFAASVRKLRKGITTRTPVFDGATEDEIWSWMDKAHLSNDGKSVLYDGRTGVPFKNRVTVGVMYMLKLHHLVDEKIHARSTGPYSLVTQQPLGGKAQFGGQRLGEMEVWALEAYGASYLLQEFLTVKSDDVTGRVKMYEKIVKGDNFLEAGMPESFNVLVKELMSLGLNVTLQQDESKPHNRRLGFIPGRSAGTAPSSAEPAQEDE